MIKIKITGIFDKQLVNLYSSHQSLQIIIQERIKLFQQNPQDTRLKNHALTKRLKGKYSFSITSDIRIIYVWVGENTVRFLAVGTHNQVYGRKVLI